MSTICILQPVQVGLVSDEPIRLEGLSSIFDGPAKLGRAQLLPVKGSVEELLAGSALELLVLDLNSSSGGLSTLKAIRRARPDIRLIVIGPGGDDQLVIDCIIAGARAYLDSSVGPQVVRAAIEAVTNGSIWAPRRLLSKLIDLLLKAPDGNIANDGPHLTDREREVLEHILLARSNREIAHHLGIEERTVKAHVGRLMRKTGADNRIELTLRAMKDSLVPHFAMVDRRKRDRRVPQPQEA